MKLFMNFGPIDNWFYQLPLFIISLLFHMKIIIIITVMKSWQEPWIANSNITHQTLSVQPEQRLAALPTQVSIKMLPLSDESKLVFCFSGNPK